MRDLFKKFNIKDKKVIIAFSVSLLIAIGLLISPSNANAGVLDIIQKVSEASLFLLVSWILYLPIYIFGTLVTSILIPMLVWVAGYNNFLDLEAVNIGWQAVRDLANIFIVIGILIIAFGTLFRIETYEYKKLLPKLVVAAILINFSKFIMGVLIDISQVIMLTFVHGFENIVAGNLINAIGISKILSLSVNQAGITGLIEADAGLELIGSLVVGVIVLVVTTAVMLVIIAYLISRIIMLWMAIILSPLLFVLPFIPAGQKFASQVWQMVSKYLMTGPLLAFFLWLSFLIMSGIGAGQAGILGTEVEIEQKARFAAFISEFGSLTNILNFIVAIGLLVGSLILATQMGVAGSKFSGRLLAGLAGAGLATALWAPKRAFGWAREKYSKGTSKLLETTAKGKPPGWGKKVLFAAMNPMAAVKGWGARSEELKQRSRELAAARGREVTEQFRTRGKVKIPYAEQLEASYESQFAKDFMQMDRNQKALVAAQLYGAKDIDSKRRWRALMKVTGEEGHVDDIISNPAFVDKVRKTRKGGEAYGQVYEKAEEGEKQDAEGYKLDKEGKRIRQQEFVIAKEGEKQDEQGYKLDEEGNRVKADVIKYNYTVAHDFFRDTLAQDQNGLRLLKELEDISKRNTHPEYGGHQVFNAEKGVWEFNEGQQTEGDMYAYGVNEFNKIPGRSRFMQSPHTYMSLRKGYLYEADLDKDDKQKVDEDGKKLWKRTIVGKASDMDDFSKRAFRVAFAGDTAGHIKEHSQSRTLTYLLGGTGDKSNLDPEGYAHITEMDLKRFKEVLEQAPDALHGAYQKAGGKVGELKFRFHDEDGKIKEEIENEEALRRLVSEELKTTVKGQALEDPTLTRGDKGNLSVLKTYRKGRVVSEGERELIEADEDDRVRLHRQLRTQEPEQAAETKQELASQVEPGIAIEETSNLNQGEFNINPGDIRKLSDELAKGVKEALDQVQPGQALDTSKFETHIEKLVNALKDNKKQKNIAKMMANNEAPEPELRYGIKDIKDIEAQKNFLRSLQKIAENLEAASFYTGKAKKEEKE